MADKRSNKIWENADNYDDFELSRPQLFREETRDLFFRYFRINPESFILERGCGTGVMTRFIASGLKGEGFITGFELSKSFTSYGNQKIREYGLRP